MEVIYTGQGPTNNQTNAYNWLKKMSGYEFEPGQKIIYHARTLFKKHNVDLSSLKCPNSFAGL